MIYDGRGLEDLQDTVSRTVIALRRRKGKFDSIVVRGNSGCLVGAPVALRLKVPLVVIRKVNEKSHDRNKVLNGMNLGYRWLFLDDFIASGSTLKACKREIKLNPYCFGAKHVATYLYRDDQWYLTPKD